MADPASPDLIAVHLYLGAFATINQEGLVVHSEDLRRGMAVMHRQRRVISKYCDGEHNDR